MAVRISLAQGGFTLFSYATSAALLGDSLVIFEWNRLTQNLDELLTFRADEVVKAEVLRGSLVTEVILGRARDADRTR